MSTLIQRYLLRRLALYSLLSLAVVVTLSLAIDGLERASLMLSRDLSWSAIVVYLGLRLGTIAHQLLVGSGCLAAAMVVATLRHRNEWDAMRALGAGPRVRLAPFVTSAVGLAILLAAFEGYVLPRTIEEASRFEASTVLGGSARFGTGAGPRWWQLDAGVLVAEDVAPSGEVLHGVSWFALRDGSIVERVDAEQLAHEGDRWRASQVTTTAFRAGEELVTTVSPRRTMTLEGLSPGGIRRRLLPLAQHDVSLLLGDPRPEARYTLHGRLAHAVSGGLLLLLAAVLVSRWTSSRAWAAATALGLTGSTALGHQMCHLMAGTLGWSPWLPWGIPAVLGLAVYFTWKYDASLRNQPLVQSA